jgi:hypothetical protein
MLKFLLVVLSFFSLEFMYGQKQINHRKICDLPLEVAESSGLLIVSPSEIWTHNDSGYDNELFLVDSNGVLLRTVIVENATNRDWEDLAYDTEGNIWINDAGNNGNARDDLRLYKVYKDDIENSDIVQAEIVQFDYPDQHAFPPANTNMNFDIEAIVYHDEKIHLFTKNRSNPTTGYTKMYSVPAFAGSYTATLVDSFFVDSDIMRSRVTASDFHVESQKLALLTRTQIIVFSGFIGSNFFQGNVERYYFKNRTEQVEALGFLTENSYYMTDEGSPSNDVPGAWYEINTVDVTSVGESDLFEISTYWDVMESKFSIQTFNENDYKISIYDTSGRVIGVEQFRNNLILNLSSYSQGLYVISINHQGQSYTQKVIKISR